MGLNGLDVSGHQEGIDLKQVPGDFALIKSSGGNSYISRHRVYQYADAVASGKLTGFYHFVDDGDGYQSPQAEADNFLNATSAWNTQPGVQLILDFEAIAVRNGRGPDWCLEWLRYVQQKANKTPWFYTYSAIEAAHNWAQVAAEGYPLWLANYPQTARYNTYVQDAPPSTRFIWKGGVVSWQYTSTGRLSGWGGNLDLNVFYGDRDAWMKLSGASGSGGFLMSLSDEQQAQVYDWAKGLAYGSLPTANGYTFSNRDAVQNNLENILGEITDLASRSDQVDNDQLSVAVSAILAPMIYSIAEKLQVSLDTAQIVTIVRDALAESLKLK